MQSIGRTKILYDSARAAAKALAPVACGVPCVRAVDTMTIGPPNDSLLPLVNTTLTAIVHAFCPLRTLPCGVACRANCSAISGSSFTELLALRSFSGTHDAELRTVGC